MSKFLKTAAVVVGAVALIATGIGAAAGVGLIGTAGSFLGVAAGTWATIGTIASVVAGVAGLAAGALAKPPKLKSSIAGQQLEWRADPASGEPYAVGETMVGASIIHQASWGDKNKYLGIVGVLSVCTISAYLGLYADMTSVSFSGRNASGYYNNFMYLSTQLGAMPESAALDMTAPDSSMMPDWGSAYKTSGLATAGLVLVADVDNGKVYSGGTPKLTNLIHGVKAYDSRLDSTQPGGSGSQRALDETTYVYSDNPWVHAETYALGRFQNGVCVIGPALPADKIDFAAFMEAANVADANGWKVSGVISSTDAKWDSLKAFAQAGGGGPIPTQALLSCIVNMPRVSLETITEADVRGAVSAPQMFTRRQRLNGAIPRIRTSDQGWEVTPLDIVRSSTYLAADGGKEKTQEIEFALVADKGDGAGKTQAAQLAAYAVANSRERGPISVELGYVWSQYKVGDCLTLDLPKARLNSQKCIVIGRTINISKNTVTLQFQTEDDAKHTWALGLTGSSTTPPTVSQPHGAGDNYTGVPAILRASYPKSLRVTASDVGTDATITLDGGSSGASFIIDYATDTPQDISVPAGSITGLAYSTTYFLYADVSGPADASPTYGATTVYADSINSSSHPNRIDLKQKVTTPASGGGTTSGGGTGSGYGSGDNTCPDADRTLVLLANETRDGPGDAKLLRHCAIGDWVWTPHEHIGEWGAYPITAISFHEAEVYSALGHPSTTPEHRFRHGDWVRMKEIGKPERMAVVGKVTVAEAHTYMTAALPAEGSEPQWVESHNVKDLP